MRKFLFTAALILSFCLPLVSQAQHKPLKNTKWIYDYGDCQEYLEFGKKNTYKIYNCETGNTIYGKYSQKGNEVILVQLRSEFDNAFKKTRGFKTPPARFKLLIDQDNMKYFVRWDVDNLGNWVLSKYESDREFVFVKE